MEVSDHRAVIGTAAATLVAGGVVGATAAALVAGRVIRRVKATGRTTGADAFAVSRFEIEQ